MDIQANSTTDQIQSDIVDLIAKQRLMRLTEGGRFIKYTSKGQRIKDRYSLCKLSANHRSIHYGDLEDNRDSQPDELTNRINVSDIKRILVGRDCPHTKDGHMKKATMDLAFSIVHESDHEDYLNFVAIDQKTYCYWIDGLNALLKKPMTSEEFNKDMQMLSRIESRVRSMNK